jgi:hypothetical protein
MSDQELVKNFCRLIVEYELSQEDIAEYFDIVTEIAETKLKRGYNAAGEEIDEFAIMEFQTDDGQFVYEIVMSDQMSLDEGQAISDELAETFSFDFEFETSLEI